MNFALIVLWTSLFLFGPTFAAKKSSVIPERREFLINNTLKPCDNFYDYVCSKTIDSFQLREDRSSHTFSFNDSSERILEKKKNFFRKLTMRKPTTDREKGLKNFYAACMDPKNRAKSEIQEIERVRKDLADIKSREDLMSWLEKAYLSGDNTGPISWGHIPNMDQPTKGDLYLEPEYISLPEKSYYKKDDVMKDFKKLATAFYKIFNKDNFSARADNLLKFETGLAESTPLPSEIRQIVNNRVFTTRDKLIQNFSNLRFNNLLSEVPSRTVIRDWFPETLKYLNEYFANEPLENIKDVLAYQLLNGYLDDSQPFFYKEKFDFEKKHLGGPNQRPTREERCTRITMSIFTKEIDFILLPEIFPGFPKEKFISLAEKIRESILKSLERNTWLSKDAKLEALNKIKKAKLQLVTPETEEQWDFLPAAEYSAQNSIQNAKMVAKVKIQKNLKNLRESLNPEIWHMGPLTVNAYYDPFNNKFVMPIGILQYPFYDPKLPLDENLAAVGSVIGHELGHGVDDQGSRYDSDGKQRQWMSMKDLAEFSNKSQLLVTQFEDAGHNGKLTLGENIGDLVGLTAAYQAASADPEFSKNSDRQKKFYEAYARVWCEVKRPKFIETFLKTNPHALGVARVNQQIKQQKGFKEAFQCKATDAMVLPEEKLVQIW